MRILHVGNADSGYVITKELRKIGWDCEFITPKQMIYGINEKVSNPLNFDDDLKDELPEWMSTYDLNEKGWKRKLIKKMRQYDLIHAYMEAPIFGLFSGKPMISQSVGDDLRELAFKNSLKGLLLRKAYGRSKMHIFEWPPHKPFVEKLKIKNSVFIPKIWDFSYFQNSNLEKNNKKTLILFHPLTQNWKEKGNDKFLKGFVKLCKAKQDVFLYYVEWGSDANNAKDLLDHPEVRKRIKTIDGPIPKNKMLEYMQKSDILVDQFNSGSFTRTGIEGMSFGIPLLMNFDEQLHLELFGKIPSVINVKDENEIFEKINFFIKNKEEIRKFGENSKKWVLNHYNIERNIQKYADIYNKIKNKS